MTEEEIKEELCYYDPRSPYYSKPYKDYNKKGCSCENCFYGRTRMAEELLKYTQYKPNTITK